MFNYFKLLSQKGVLGINNRNANYTLKYNSRNKYPLVDNKLKTKQLAIEAGIPVPELYAVIEIERQIQDIDDIIKDQDAFVVKPACGSGGNGIVVIADRARDMYRKASGNVLTSNELRYHISNILSGLYSLGGQSDKAIIEYRVQPDLIFEPISYMGVPDIRIIVFFGIPVMSMVRLPTRMSDGKANLHQGAIGAGINIATGITLSAVWKDIIITRHPDTGQPVTNIKIPFWEKLLDIASRCYEITGLAYQGVDIVLDKNQGPMILELNARPGLNIQIANQSGLLKRLKWIEQHRHELNSMDDKVQFAVRHFKQ
ncbi:alpha-L-glutamate ligase-like protein [Desulfobacter hydrogenophilus]|uniref:Alpha-L-glutamate ligase-like protein n=1 Tax=Desulfobacter hydrogenophilus TaxID=2291 RepID=A0A328FEF5_9BACT|nr:alpha-L-glutamate ligase-like protein [Desulfobacter hydrogenophilus]NDY71915.1 alpha-L-glutamate ligase-like protein [Desulfobacter hydrogenophilus]QBH11951.1 alpha-L-glutamate ligase-like protein [Desulfobacter hydrogenophilus]RAM02689.1 alpha-L-glutamate ligase-like protein [Desulfobacter hydrogenophilus]